jgi:hypothetical protein
MQSAVGSALVQRGLPWMMLQAGMLLARVLAYLCLKTWVTPSD